ncbi:hypothetical protein [Chitinophaga sp. YR627]|nr:hypothetical protein [Chitinophaga sp. YR627]
MRNILKSYCCLLILPGDIIGFSIPRADLLVTGGFAQDILIIAAFLRKR